MQPRPMASPLLVAAAAGAVMLYIFHRRKRNRVALLSRQCNGLEALFVNCNIRFATAVAFPAVPIEAAQACVSSAARAVPSGRLEVALIDKTPHLRLIETASAEFDMERVVMPERGLAQALDDFVDAAALPANGALRFRLLTKSEEPGSCCGFCVNANHALCDGRAMRNMIETAVNSLLLGATIPEAPVIGSVPKEWGAVVEAAIPEENARDPAFLPLPAASITLDDIEGLRQVDSQEHQLARHDISTEKVEKLKAVLRAHGATMTGLWAACLTHALSEAYLRQGGAQRRCVSASLLVDLRKHLSRHGVDASTCTNMFGSITVGSITATVADEVLHTHVLALSRQLTQDMRIRIARGEAHRSSVSVSRGDWAAGPPPATIELSSHGVYDAPGCCDVLLSQRFDGYDGISVAVLTQKAGKMRLAASLGCGLNQGLSSRLIKRAVRLAEHVAAACCSQ
jgi:hypothetical protein